MLEDAYEGPLSLTSLGNVLERQTPDRTLKVCWSVKRDTGPVMQMCSRHLMVFPSPRGQGQRTTPLNTAWMWC